MNSNSLINTEFPIFLFVLELVLVIFAFCGISAFHVSF